MTSQIRKSIIGDARVSLTKFTYDCAEKYRHGKASTEALGEGYIARAAILVCILPLVLGLPYKLSLQRRFAIEHKKLLVADEESASAGDNGPKRKRSKPAGRLPVAQDFWSQVDLWLASEIEERGKDVADTAWKM